MTIRTRLSTYDFEVSEDQNTRHYVPASASEIVGVIVYSVWYIYMYHLLTEKEKRTELLRLKEVNIPAYHVFRT